MYTLFLSSDHAGYDLRQSLCRTLLKRDDLAVQDLGCEGPDSVDYPDFARRLAEAMANAEGARGILICGTGIGISISINRWPHIRAGLVHDVTTARLARAHNDINVLALGARVIGAEVALECVHTFLTTDFEGGRHQRRVDKMSGGP